MTEIDSDIFAKGNAPEPVRSAVVRDHASVSDTLAVLAPVAETVRLALARLEAMPVATATPEERRSLVELYHELERIRVPIDLRMNAIQLAFARAFAETGGDQLPLSGGGVVRYKPARGEWKVDGEGLRKKLEVLRVQGKAAITAEEIEDALPRLVVVKADNRKLNYLRDHRGDAVAGAVDEHRQWQEPSALAGKVELPK